jgi:hypothetical protein
MKILFSNKIYKFLPSYDCYYQNVFENFCFKYYWGKYEKVHILNG